MIEQINNKSKVEVLWTVSPYDYSIPEKRQRQTLKINMRKFGVIVEFVWDKLCILHENIICVDCGMTRSIMRKK